LLIILQVGHLLDCVLVALMLLSLGCAIRECLLACPGLVVSQNKSTADRKMIPFRGGIQYVKFRDSKKNRIEN